MDREVRSQHIYRRRMHIFIGFFLVALRFFICSLTKLHTCVHCKRGGQWRTCNYYLSGGAYCAMHMYCLRTIRLLLEVEGGGEMGEIFF